MLRKFTELSFKFKIMERFVKTRGELERMVSDAYNAGIRDAVKTFAPEMVGRVGEVAKPVSTVKPVRVDKVAC